MRYKSILMEAAAYALNQKHICVKFYLCSICVNISTTTVAPR